MKLFLLLFGLLAAPLAAQLRPTPGDADPRLQTVIYDPDRVVELDVAAGYQLMVSLTGERIETVAVGDTNGWSVTPSKRGDAVFIKANDDAQTTNLTVVTDARVYAFALARAFGPSGDLPYIVRFADPTQDAPIDAAAALQPQYRYRVSGIRDLRPSEIAVEPGRIALTWPATAPLPAVFRIEGDGVETLVNGEMIDGRFIIDGTPRALVFRLDRQIARATRLVVKDRQ
jgi:type IV secretion system protein VirB9